MQKRFIFASIWALNIVEKHNDISCKKIVFTWHKKSQETVEFPGLAEEAGFEPADGFTRQTISNRSRYDHFDTPPYIIYSITKLIWTNHSFEKLMSRLSRNPWLFAHNLAHIEQTQGIVYPKNLDKSRVFSGRGTNINSDFQSFSLWPLRYPSECYIQPLNWMRRINPLHSMGQRRWL